MTKYKSTLLSTFAAFGMMVGIANGNIIIAEYAFGQAGPTTTPSGQFEDITAGDVLPWGSPVVFDVNNNPGESLAPTEPVLVITRASNVSGGGGGDAAHAAGFYIDITIPSSVATSLTEISFTNARNGTSNERTFQFGYMLNPSGAPTATVNNLLGTTMSNVRPTFDLYTVDLSNNSDFQNISDTVIRFQWSVASNSNDFGQSFDDIIVTAIPEPSTYAAIAGLLALGLVAWRRRKS